MSVLDKIISAKRRRLSIKKLSNTFSDHYIENSPDTKVLKFFETLNSAKGSYKIIAEIKKGSPSAGIIIEDYHPEEIAKKYLEKGFTNLSVLTEEDFFYGSPRHINIIKKMTNTPILQKDFIIDEWQIYHAKTLGVSCVLLISEVLTKAEIKSFIKIAKSLDLDILLEFHEESEMQKILDVDLEYIGINNRNLKTIQTDINHCLKIKEKYYKELERFKIVAESGFTSKKELERYKRNEIELFLIGESLLKEKL